MDKVTTDVVVAELGDGPHAPFISFDHAPTFGCNDGVINLTLTAVRYLPAKDHVVIKPAVTAHLRCSRAAALRLRDTIDRALLMTEPHGQQN